MRLQWLSAASPGARAELGSRDSSPWTPRYNIAPTQEVLAILWGPNRPELHLAVRRWGLIPVWAEGPAVGSGRINARLETGSLRPAYVLP